MWTFLFQVTNIRTGQWILSTHKSMDIYFGTPDATDHSLPASTSFKKSFNQYGPGCFRVRVYECNMDNSYIEKKYKDLLKNHVNDPLCWNFEKLRNLDPKLITDKRMDAVFGTDNAARARAFVPPMSDETKAKKSAALKGIPLDPEHAAKIKASKQGRTWITDGVQTKFHKRDEPIPEGWRIGHPPRQSSKAKRVWITNDIRNRLHAPEEPIPEGWRLGKAQIFDKPK
jgi:hypothetical protein